MKDGSLSGGILLESLVFHHLNYSTTFMVLVGDYLRCIQLLKLGNFNWAMRKDHPTPARIDSVSAKAPVTANT
mgnify:CR=1 FL=1